MFYACSAFSANGPYIGIGLGYTNSLFDVDEVATVIKPIFGESSKTYYGSADGVQEQLVAGYTYDIHKYRLGAEIMAQIPKISHANNTDHLYYYELTSAYGINFVPGYSITDRNWIYLKIGATRGKFTHKNINDTGYSILNVSFYSTGLNLGVGMETYLTKNLGLRLEYLCTLYETQRFTPYLLLPDSSELMIDAKIQPQVHMVMLGIDYQFDLFS